MKQYRVAVVVGSLREQSYNRRLAQALVTLFPAHIQCEFISIGSLPLYNQDADPHPSPVVSAFKQQIEPADGVIFVTAEYNRSIPGVLKNALDQGSRPWGQNSWDNKPAGVIGTSPGAMGTAMAQQHLRNVLAFLNMPTLNQPEMYLQWHDDMIDANGRFNEKTGAFVQKWVDAYTAFLAQHG
ncbi:NADPH-dependent FMN reductase [Morganella psychrotolerans]|uniref:NADPH-dependent FMN reductase n=1 Tax=Morganella psychrotolerans TaxID=368603 RepID=UPI0039B0BD24